MTDRNERHAVDVANAAGSVNFEASGDADLATELFQDGAGWCVAVDVTVGPISTGAVLDEAAARRLHSQLGEYITRMDTEDTGVAEVNPGP